MTILKTILAEMDAKNQSWDELADNTLNQMSTVFRTLAQLRFHNDVKYDKDVNRKLMEATKLLEDSMDELKQAMYQSDRNRKNRT